MFHDNRRQLDDHVLQVSIFLLFFLHVYTLLGNYYCYAKQSALAILHDNFIRSQTLMVWALTFEAITLAKGFKLCMQGIL
ncbi:hypothetical protein DD594_28340, partial [Enterobacter cloacae complex sp. 4DZ1-17B1]